MQMEHMEDPPVGASIGQLGHHIGLHVDVNLQGKTIGGLYCEAEQWVPGVIIGQGALGNSLTIKLDMPIGGGQRGGFLHRQSRGEDLIAIDDAARVRPRTLANVQPSGVPNEIVELARAGKAGEAIKRYRALNGATLEEAQAVIATLSPLGG